jgi:hypothetical protein
VTHCASTWLTVTVQFAAVNSSDDNLTEPYLRKTKAQRITEDSAEVGVVVVGDFRLSYTSHWQGMGWGGGAASSIPSSNGHATRPSDRVVKDDWTEVRALDDNHVAPSSRGALGRTDEGGYGGWCIPGRCQKLDARNKVAVCFVRTTMPH